MTTEEFLKKGKKKFGEAFESMARYAAGMLCRQVFDMENCLEILEELDNGSYEVNEG